MFESITNLIGILFKNTKKRFYLPSNVWPPVENKTIFLFFFFLLPPVLESTLAGVDCWGLREFLICVESRAFAMTEPKLFE